MKRSVFQFLWIAVVTLVMHEISKVQVAAQCANSDTLSIGKGLTSIDDTVDSNTAAQYLMTDTGYVSDCCGVIRQWSVVAGNTGVLTFQVWRPVGGGTYELIGENTETITTTDTELDFDISTFFRIAIQSGDTIGWYSNGTDIVKYKAGGGRGKNNFIEAGSPEYAIGTSVLFTNDFDDRDYAFRATLDPGGVPSFTNLDATISKNKNSFTVGVSVYNVTASDPELETMIYSLDSISPSADFSVDSSTGEVKPLTASVTIGTYTLTISATDSCGNSDTNKLTIVVPNLAPVIYSLPASVSVNETETSQMVLHTVNSTDPDSDTVICSISSSPSGPFYIVGSDIYLQSNPNLDYDVTPVYTVTAACTDSIATTTADLTVSLIKNSAPVITSLPDATSVNESETSELLLHTVAVTDAPKGKGPSAAGLEEEEENGDYVTCNISSTSPANAPFTYRFSGSGLAITTTIYLESNPNLDYDVTTTYVITVMCNDGTDVTTADFTVYVIKNIAPVILSLPDVSIVSEASTDETLLHTVNSTDANGDPVLCSLASTTPANGPFITKFSSDGSGGLLTSVYLRSSPNLNYTVTPSYDLLVNCTDNIDYTTSILYVYVTQNDVPIIHNLQNSTSIVSSLPIGSDVFQVLATDAENDAMTFSLKCVSPTSCPFLIYSTGIVTLGSSLVGTSTYGYEVDVRVSDTYTSTGYHRLTIFVTDINSVPILDNLPASVQVAEGSSVGTWIFNVSVYDQDGDTGHVFSYNIAPSDGYAYFDCNAATGEVKVASNILSTIASTIYNITVEASDALDTSTSQVLTVEIVVINEAPVLYQTNYMIQGYEDSAGTSLPDPGYAVSDPDGDALTFTLTGNDTAGFNINTTTGVLSYSVAFDTDDTSVATNYVWLIVISDPAGLAATATLTLSILDTNDNTPLFSHLFYSSSTYHDTALATTLITVSATDDDVTPSYGLLEYSVETTTNNPFRIDNSGHVFVYSNLGPYNNSQVTFGILVYNPGSTSQDTASVAIYVYLRTDDGDAFFDDPANVAWVTLTCILAAAALAGTIFLTWWLCKNYGTPANPTPKIQQVAPNDTRMTPKRRPVSRSTILSVREVTPSDIRMIDSQWKAWGNNWFEL